MEKSGVGKHLTCHLTLMQIKLLAIWNGDFVGNTIAIHHKNIYIKDRAYWNVSEHFWQLLYVNLVKNDVSFMS